MASKINVKREDSLPDLEVKTEEGETFEATEFENDMEMGEYQAENDESEENADIMSTLIVEGNATEGLEPQEDEDTYLTEDIEGSQGQQFLTISQGNSQIAVNDNGSIVYSDTSFIEDITNQLAEKEANQVEAVDENTLYYQTSVDEMETEYLQEGSELNEDVGETRVLEESDDNTLVFTQQDAEMEAVNETVLQHVNQAGEPYTVAVNRADLKSYVAIQPETRAVKRPIQPSTSSKNIIAKVFVQNSNKGAGKNISNMGGRTMSLAQAQRLGLLKPKFQVLNSGISPGRVMVKKVVASSSKSPTKILPAPAPKGRISLTGVRGSIGQPVRSTIPVSQLKTFLTSSSSPRTVTLATKTLGGVSVSKGDGRSPQKVYLRTNVTSSTGGQVRLPQDMQYVQLINSLGGSGVQFKQVKPRTVQTVVARSIAPTPTVSKSTDSVVGKRIFVNMGGDGKKVPIQMKSSSGLPMTYTIKDFNQLKSSTQIKDQPKSEPQMIVLADELDENADDGGLLPEEFGKENEEVELRSNSPHRLLEANGIRPKKPCNCTRSQCLKLYCECFANGEFCFQCNCINCFNNIEHEEERKQSMNSCLERNPKAFRPKIQMVDVDDEERRHNKGCNCKRSYCLKNYCECFEAKLSCGKYCKCLSCRNTEEELGKWERGEGPESADEETVAKGTPFLPQPLAEALCQCILVQAETAERKGEDVVTTEQRIIEELGQRLVQIIGNRSKKDSR